MQDIVNDADRSFALEMGRIPKRASERPASDTVPETSRPPLIKDEIKSLNF